MDFGKSETSFKSTGALFVCLLALFIGQQVCLGGSAKLSDYVHLPPVMLRSLGDPWVKFYPEIPTEKGAATKLSGPVLKLSRTTKIASILVAKNDMDGGEASYRSTLARAVLDYFWEERLEGNNSSGAAVSLIPMDKKRFLSLGMVQLLGVPGNDLSGNAWWRVRMDLPLTFDTSHQLIVMTIRREAEIYSHFALGVWTVGGSGAGDADWVLDPRARWLSEEDPKLSDWLNLDHSLAMKVEVARLSDWLHTQTTYRGMEVSMKFMPATKEHVTLLVAAAHSEYLITADLGPLRPLRNNCATWGQELIEGLLPLDERLCGRHPIADLPKRLSRRACRRLGETVQVQIPRSKPPLGVTPSKQSVVRRGADPLKIPAILQLNGTPSINGSFRSLSGSGNSTN